MPPRLGPAFIAGILVAVTALGGCASRSGPVTPDPAAIPPVATGTANSGDPADPNGPAPVSAGVPDPAPPTGITVGQRAASAVEGVMMGAVLGSQAGPLGAAVGAGALLIYSAITGQVPFQSGGGGRSGSPGRMENDREAALEAELENSDRFTSTGRCTFASIY